VVTGFFDIVSETIDQYERCLEDHDQENSIFCKKCTGWSSSRFSNSCYCKIANFGGTNTACPYIPNIQVLELNALGTILVLSISIMAFEF